MYRKLKRTWSHNDLNYIPRLREVFPELKKISSEELCDRFIDLKLDFYTEEKTKVKLITRLSLPFALIMYLLMLIYLPINFIISGKLGYGFNDKNYIYNWFKSLRLV